MLQFNIHPRASNWTDSDSFIWCFYFHIHSQKKENLLAVKKDFFLFFSCLGNKKATEDENEEKITMK